MLAVALSVRAISGRWIDRALRLKAAPLWLLPIRDLLSFGVFIASFLGRSVAWRDRRFRIVVDYGFSGASYVLPLVLGPLGVEVNPLVIAGAVSELVDAVLVQENPRGDADLRASVPGELRDGHSAGGHRSILPSARNLLALENTTRMRRKKTT